MDFEIDISEGTIILTRCLNDTNIVRYFCYQVASVLFVIVFLKKLAHDSSEVNWVNKLTWDKAVSSVNSDNT